MDEPTRKVWDLPVRIFHWTLVAAIVGAYVTNRLGVNYFTYHLWCGYTVLVLVTFRIVWGIVGTRHARFWNFVRGPVTTLRYGVNLLRGTGAHAIGHNPLGALMVLLLLVMLLVQALTGLFGNDEIMNQGPLYGYVNNARSLVFTSLHRKLFYWILAAVALHILAVLYHQVWKREPLVRAMWTGHKPADVVPASQAITGSRWWLALVIVVVLCLALAWIVRHAPVSTAADSYM